MTSDRKEPDAIEEVSVKKPRISVTLILAVLLGLLVAAAGVGAFMHFRQSKALQAELLVVKRELKKKELAVDEMTAQLASLSSQMHVLKGYSIARSGVSGEKDGKNECPSVASDAVPDVQPSAESKGKVSATEATASLSGKQTKHEPNAGAGDAQVRPKPPSETENKAPASEPALVPLVAKPKPTSRQDCELVGKSPEEQAETLKRCVSLIDSPPRRNGSR